MYTIETPAQWELDAAAAIRGAMTSGSALQFNESGKWYIAGLYDAICHLPCVDGASLEQFKEWLVRANRLNLVVLHRADLVAAHRICCANAGKPDLLDRSHTADRGAEWQLVSLPGGQA